ncbi:MAG: prepilin-type N-terminal cleavage/methylation domain-containing protein [Clostridia bacterium]|nr:prepilin-type N-terminal cleavage/methylation domain-containing protein [Clostridia bacterium]
MCKQHNIKKHQGFTLVELLVTIAILAVLATVSVVGYTKYIEKSAVTTDTFLVKQLNDFTKLYEIEHSDDLEEADIRNLLKNAGLESIELKSEGYEYRLYFDKNNQKFVLATEKKDNYILIDDEFLSAIDSTPDSGNEGTSGEGGDENIQAPGDGNTDDTGSSDGADEPDIVEPNLVLKDFEIVNNDKKRYVKAENGIINVGIYFLDNEPVKLEFSKSYLQIYDKNTGIEYDIIEYNLDDKIINTPKIVINDLIEKVLSLTVLVDDNTYTINVPVKVKDVTIEDAEIKYTNHSTILTISPNLEKPATYDLNFMIMENMIIYDYDKDNQGIVYDWSTMDKGEKTELLERIRITIKSNANEYQINNDSMIESKSIDASGYIYHFVIIENIDQTEIEVNYEITYEYLGNNGLWISVTVPVEKVSF